MTAASVTPTPHAVKQRSLGLLAEGTEKSIRESSGQIQATGSSHTRLSAWTPIANKSFNKHLFQERIGLISHWFDLWTDKQRKQFLHTILMKCSKSQLRFTQNWFAERIPVTKVDFTSVLPRFISLYIFSFLSPKELCAAAQVSWHWKFLTEQDCLWMPKCIKFGWFLPYTPTDNEHSAWKRHYITCATTLDYLTPREASKIYGTLNEPKSQNEEQEERLREKQLRKMIQERLALHKKALFKARPPWGSRTWSSRFLKSSLQPCPAQTIQDCTRLQAALLIIKVLGSLPTKTCFHLILCRSKLYLSRNHLLEKYINCLLSFLNNSFLQMVLDSTKPEVVPMVYEHSGMTLESLFFYIEKALDGRKARSIGIFSDGDSREISLLQGCRISIENILSSEIREFWEKLGGCVTSPEEGGHVDIFVPLAASETGMEVLSHLSHLTGVFFRAPTGIATGSYQHILSEWLGKQKDGSPTSIYFTEVKLQMWLRLTELMEDAMKPIRKQMRPYFRELQRNISDRLIGHFMFDAISTGRISTDQEVAQTTADGLTELSKRSYVSKIVKLLMTGKRHLKDSDDQRTRFARELLRSERNYVQMLEIVRDVYSTPLKAALASNRAILSHANVQIIFSDILGVLQLNREILDDLTERLEEWSPAQCLGDIFIKFGLQLQTYTNFFNNYTVVLKTIDKCRQTIPLFWAFLKRHDKTIATNMRSLQELLLCPCRRFEEYINLLYALRLHTPPDHADWENLTAAIKKMKQYKDYVDQVCHLRSLSVRQKSGQEANRYLIKVQDVAQVSCSSEEIHLSLRLYEHVSDLSLFLFNDALVISSCNISYKPFERIPNTSYQFLASVALHRLLVEDIPDSKYIKNAFILQGPKQQWTCSTEDEDSKFTWLSVLHSAINCSIEKS
uniref:Epithelial cell transforming 2 like n=1 Tax=Crocodylus porosus TaxID=8502 RepID=A0A7M4DYU1_CROPO